MAWATSAIGGSVWGVGGVASDGTNPFITTGNTFNTGGNWMGGEAVIRFQPGPIFTGLPADYWAPVDWLTLDNQDKDLGSCGPLLMDVPGATPSALVVAIGKDRNARLLDRNHLGGIIQRRPRTFQLSCLRGGGNLSDKSGYLCRRSRRRHPKLVLVNLVFRIKPHREMRIEGVVDGKRITGFVVFLHDHRSADIRKRLGLHRCGNAPEKGTH